MKSLTVSLFCITLGCMAFTSADAWGSEFIFDSTTQNVSRSPVVSGDGSAVVGYLGADVTDGYVWTVDDGFQRIPAPSILGESNRLDDVSDDGKQFLGGGHDRNFVTINYIWNTEDAYQFLPDAPGYELTNVYEISGDGNTVIGRGANGEGEEQIREYWLWTSESGMTFLPLSEGLGFPQGLSYDGDVAVFSRGVFSTETGETLAPSLYGPTPFIHAASSDASVLVGLTGGNPNGLIREAYVWNRATGEVAGLGSLPEYPTHDRSLARGVSADGKVVVGDSRPSESGPSLLEDRQAFVWDERNGMRELAAVFRDEYKMDLPAEHLNTVGGISDDRRTLAGLFADKNMWIARLDWPIGSIRSDFDLDDTLDADDADLLTTAIVDGDTDPLYDLDANGVVDAADLTDLLVRADRKLGDTNFDGSVNFADFLALSDHFGDAGRWSQGDFDASGHVDFADFLALSENFGTTLTASPTAVPEPAGGQIILTMALSLLYRRRHDSRPNNKETAK